MFDLAIRPNPQMQVVICGRMGYGTSGNAPDDGFIEDCRPQEQTARLPLMYVSADAGMPSFSAILTSSANDLAAIFRITWQRWTCSVT